MLIGLIALTGGRYDNWGDIDKMGAALKVLMLPVFYGYMIKRIVKMFAWNSRIILRKKCTKI